MNVLSPEKHSSTIFKDIMNPEFVTKLPEENLLTECPGPVEIEGTFFMLLSTKSEKLSQFYLQLCQGKIYLRLSQNSPILAFVDIDYSRMKLIHSTNVVGKMLCSIRFVKGRTYEEIFHIDLTTAKMWFEVLKRYCILYKFRESYEIGKTIGKGNFAKVFACIKIQTNEEFAVKVFDKKLILKDKFERVNYNKSAMFAIRTQDDERSQASKLASNNRDLRRGQQYLLFGFSLQRRVDGFSHSR